jgi:hypothetical protein
MAEFGDAKNPKYACKNCDFLTCNKRDYLRHTKTIKHQNLLNGPFGDGFGDAFTQKTQLYVCKNCFKEYKSRNGLWSHKKICTCNNQSSNAKQEEYVLSDINAKDLIIKLMQQNKELRELVMEQSKDFQKTLIEIAKDKSITNNTTNNNNQSFNMNFFLNEQCKDALDIMDFVNSLQLSISDLENTGKDGYVKGISDIFIRGLRELDVYKRPIHCSDLKREVMYVKDNDVWEKDDDKKKVKKAIQHIGGRNFKQFKEWVDLNPEARDVRTKKHDQYVNILTRCTGGADSQEDDLLFNKIITNIAKEVKIEK